jgi:hypothetical protein
MVAEVVSVVLTTIGHDLSAKKALLLREVEELGCTIAVAKVEIAALQVDDIKEREIPFATDELDAIVEHTAQATNDILESCERVDEVPAARPCVLTSPATLFVPPGPCSRTCAVVPVEASVLAWMWPPARTRFCTIPSAAAAVSSTVPPVALMTPVLVTRAWPPCGVCFTAPVTSDDTRPSPFRAGASKPHSFSRFPTDLKCDSSFMLDDGGQHECQHLFR